MFTLQRYFHLCLQLFIFRHSRLVIKKMFLLLVCPICCSDSVNKTHIVGNGIEEGACLHQNYMFTCVFNFTSAGGTVLQWLKRCSYILECRICCSESVNKPRIVENGIKEVGMFRLELYSHLQGGTLVSCQNKVCCFTCRTSLVSFFKQMIYRWLEL